MRLIDADELKKQILISCLYLAVTGDITDKHIANLFAEAFVKIIDKHLLFHITTTATMIAMQSTKHTRRAEKTH